MELAEDLARLEQTTAVQRLTQEERDLIRKVVVNTELVLHYETLVGDGQLDGDLETAIRAYREAHGLVGWYTENCYQEVFALGERGLGYWIQHRDLFNFDDRRLVKEPGGENRYLFICMDDEHSFMNSLLAVSIGLGEEALNVEEERRPKIIVQDKAALVELLNWMAGIQRKQYFDRWQHL